MQCIATKGYTQEASATVANDPSVNLKVYPNLPSGREKGVPAQRGHLDNFATEVHASHCGCAPARRRRFQDEVKKGKSREQSKQQLSQCPNNQFKRKMEIFGWWLQNKAFFLCVYFAV